MANIVPGALWKPVDVGNRAARRKGRGLIGHIAVVNSTLLVPGPLSTRPSDWHFYLPKNPYPTGQRFAQLIDLDLQSWSSADANPTCAAFESEGGVGTDVNGLWTANQVESAAIILAHMHNTEGVPLQDMVNSLPTSRGFGVHRYGIDPYRVAGGEKWSSVYAKACPGDNRLKQIGAIVARAQQIVNGDSDLDGNQATQLDYIYKAVRGGNADAKWDVLSLLWHGLFDALNSDNHEGNADDNTVGHTVSGHKYGKQASDKADQIIAALAKLGSAPVSGGSVVGSLSDDDVARIADALAAKLAGRLQS